MCPGYRIALVLALSFLSPLASAGPDEPKPALPTKGTTIRVELKPRTTKPNTTETTSYLGEVLETGEKEVKISATKVSTRIVYEHPLAGKVPFGRRLMRNVGIGVKPLSPAEDVTILVSNIANFKVITPEMLNADPGCTFQRRLSGAALLAKPK